MRYDPALGTKTSATVSGAVAYDDPLIGKVYHIVINQAIYIPHLDNHLLCPMQCQVNDITVDKTPNILVHDPTDHTHALAVKAPHNPAQMVILPLALQGVTLLINVRVLTLDEWNRDAFTRLSLTSESLTWDQTMTQYEKQEAAMTDYSGSVVNCTAVREHDGILAINSHSSLTTDLADVTDDENFYQVLTSRVQILSLKSSHNGHIRS